MKKAQTEIMGLVMIVVLITLILLFVVKFVVINQPKETRKEFIDERLASNTLNVLLSTTTECNKAAIGELIKDCVEYYPDGSIICEDTSYSCNYVKEIVKNILEESLGVMDKEYRFSVEDSDIEIGEECEEGIIAATQPISLGYKTIIVKLEICR